jgi:hypothetical protein
VDSDSPELASLPLVLPVRLLHLRRLVLFLLLLLSLHFLQLLLVLQQLLVTGHVRALFPFDISAGKNGGTSIPPRHDAIVKCDRRGFERCKIE